MEPRRLGPDGLTEQHDDTKLIWIDTEGDGEEGDDGRDSRGDEKQKGARKASTARHDLLELGLAAFR